MTKQLENTLQNNCNRSCGICPFHTSFGVRVKDKNSFEAHYTTASVSMQEQSAGNLVNLDRSEIILLPL